MLTEKEQNRLKKLSNKSLRLNDKRMKVDVLSARHAILTASLNANEVKIQKALGMYDDSIDNLTFAVKNPKKTAVIKSISRVIGKFYGHLSYAYFKVRYCRLFYKRPERLNHA